MARDACYEIKIGFEGDDLLGMGCGQRRVLSSRSNQDRQVLVGVLPESEELLILRSTGAHVTSVCLNSCKPEVRERKQGREGIESRVGEDVLVLGRGVLFLVRNSIGFAPLCEGDETAG